MEFKLKPCHKNSFPLGGILIKGTSAAQWIKEIQQLQLKLKEIQIYPVPGTVVNTVWGCFIVIHKEIDVRNIGKHQLCQKVASTLFIPERAILQPATTTAELERLFASGIHLFHPEFGLAELSDELDLEALIAAPSEAACQVIRPEDSVFIPKQIKSFLVKPLSPEEILKNFEEKVVPKKEKLKNKPLNAYEKARLALYKKLFSKRKNKPKRSETGSATEKTGLMSNIEAFFDKLFDKKNNWTDRMEQDFEDLEERNQKQIDKLLDMLKNNPDEALKYAIPLDNANTFRGDTSPGQLDLAKRWSDFSLFGNGQSTGARSGSGAVDIGDYYTNLQNQYYATALEMIAKKEYEKAAFIYMKLLKNYQLAAQTLEDGKFYQEAAMIYLKYAKNKVKAAECYEKGNMTTEAIEVYKELNNNEKVGDLYLTIGKRKEADSYYEKVVDAYKANHQYLKASLVCKNKLHNEHGGQELLLEGWRNNRDATNCLHHFFAAIEDMKDLKKEIAAVYSNDVLSHNRETFLKVIHHEYSKKNELSDYIKDIAYEVIAAQIKTNPAIASELNRFNNKDSELLKDTMRFKMNGKKRKSL